MCQLRDIVNYMNTRYPNLVIIDLCLDATQMQTYVLDFGKFNL